MSFIKFTSLEHRHHDIQEATFGRNYLLLKLGVTAGEPVYQVGIAALVLAGHLNSTIPF